MFLISMFIHISTLKAELRVLQQKSKLFITQNNNGTSFPIPVPYKWHDSHMSPCTLEVCPFPLLRSPETFAPQSLTILQNVNDWLWALQLVSLRSVNTLGDKALNLFGDLWLFNYLLVSQVPQKVCQEALALQKHQFIHFRTVYFLIQKAVPTVNSKKIKWISKSSPSVHSSHRGCVLPPQQESESRKDSRGAGNTVWGMVFIDVSPMSENVLKISRKALVALLQVWFKLFCQEL